MDKVVPVILHTDGSGLWSNTPKKVRITRIVLEHIKDYGDEWAHLEVYFDKRYWNVDNMGLIYTDKRFNQELLTHLRKFNPRIKAGRNDPWGGDVGYSEQGMQGYFYVHFDVDTKAIQRIKNIPGVEYRTINYDYE